MESTNVMILACNCMEFSRSYGSMHGIEWKPLRRGWGCIGDILISLSCLDDFWKQTISGIRLKLIQFSLKMKINCEKPN